VVCEDASKPDKRNTTYVGRGWTRDQESPVAQQDKLMSSVDDQESCTHEIYTSIVEGDFRVAVWRIECYIIGGLAVSRNGATLGQVLERIGRVPVEIL
jgi:hypothetical protein